MNPYFGTTDDGTDLYGSPGAFTDENGISLSIPGGTGVTLADGSTSTIGGTAAAPAPTAPTANNTSWVSGLGAVFGSIGTTLTAVTKAQQKPLINPATGLPYPGVNPLTGNPTNTSQNSLLLIVLVVVVAWVFLKKA
jgi:hypothetical protein